MKTCETCKWWRPGQARFGTCWRFPPIVFANVVFSSARQTFDGQGRPQTDKDEDCGEHAKRSDKPEDWRGWVVTNDGGPA